MKLFLNTTSGALLYRRDDEPLVSMYGSAANTGVQFDDPLNTQVRAFGTSFSGVHCISINQDGVGHRHFYVPVGTPLTLEGTEVTPRGYERLLSPFQSGYKGTVYQHRLYFQTVAQAKKAVSELLHLNMIVFNLRGSRNSRSISFQTPYILGPVLRGTVYCQTQPLATVFNRQPKTWEEIHFFHKVTLGQVILTLFAFLISGDQVLNLLYFNGFIPSFDLWSRVIMSLLVTILVAWISPDVLGLAQSFREQKCLQQRKGGKA